MDEKWEYWGVRGFVQMEQGANLDKGERSTKFQDQSYAGDRKELPQVKH